MNRLLAILALAVLVSCDVPATLPDPPRADASQKEVTKKDYINGTFAKGGLDLIEGIWVWDDNGYEVAIIKNTSNSYPQYDYLGIVTDSDKPKWSPGSIKLLIKKTVSDSVYTGNYFMGDATQIGTTFVFQNNNYIEYILPTGPYQTKEKHALIRTFPSGQQAGRTTSVPTVRQTGTGFFISNDIIVTNYHVVAEFKILTATMGDKKIPVTLVMKDPVNDLALLKIQVTSSLPADKMATGQIQGIPLSIGDVRNIRDGEGVFTIGYPLSSDLGQRSRISEGIINSSVGMHDDPRMIQISVPIQPGNSGGPLFNKHGEVIGIVTSTINNAYLIINKNAFSQNVNFAVKINYLNNLISLLPDNISLPKSASSGDLDASKIMEQSKSSVVLIEASR